MESSAVPVVVKCLAKHRVVSLFAGRHHTAVLVEQGQMYLLGSNSDGQLGIGSLKQKNSPALVKELEQEKAVVNDLIVALFAFQLQALTIRVFSLFKVWMLHMTRKIFALLIWLDAAKFVLESSVFFMFIITEILRYSSWSSNLVIILKLEFWILIWNEVLWLIISSIYSWCFSQLLVGRRLP